MDRANWALASYLAKQDVETHLVAYRVDEELTKQPNIVVHRVARPLNSFFLGEPLLDLAGRMWARRLSSSSLRVVVNGGNCLWGDANWVHYVHAAWPSATNPNAVRRAKIALAHRFAAWREKAALGSARVILANSNRTKRDISGNLCIPANRISTIYYGTDATVFRPASEPEREQLRKRLKVDRKRPLLAFIGGLGNDRKGFDTVFSAWKQLCSRPSWDADLVVVGCGSELSYWKAQAKQKSIGSRIQFLGFRDDVPDILRACDAFVAPTRYEAFGLAAQEALCCGLVVFVSRSAGVAERFPADLHDLLLDDPGNVGVLVEKLLQWRADIPSYRSRIRPLSEQLRSCSWDDMASKIVAAMDTAA